VAVGSGSGSGSGVDAQPPRSSRTIKRAVNFFIGSSFFSNEIQSPYKTTAGRLGVASDFSVSLQKEVERIEKIQQAASLLKEKRAARGSRTGIGSL
jgi:hypothetical protein